jgi:outer membrane lipoprotein-sorting protein
MQPQTLIPKSGDRMRIACPLLVIAFSLTASAQTPATHGDARSTVERSSAAMGCSLINPNTAIHVAAHLQVTSLPAPMTLTIDSQGNSRWRSELDTPKEHKVTIVNNGKGQTQHADGRVTPLTENNTSHQRPMHIPCLTNIALPAGSVDATYVRTEAAGADSLDVIELLPVARPALKAAADQMKTTVWISQTTGYLTRLQYINAAEQDSSDAQTVEIDYFDYRAINGLAVPFHQITHSGAFTLDLQIDSVQLNAPAADFQLR